MKGRKDEYTYTQIRMISDDVRAQVILAVARVIRIGYVDHETDTVVLRDDYPARHQIGRPRELDEARIALETVLPLIEVYYEQQIRAIEDAAYYLAFGPGAMSNPVIAALNEVRERP